MSFIVPTKIGAKIDVNCEFGSIIKPKFLVHSIWDCEHWRGGKLIGTSRDGNVCTDEGINALLDIMFHGATQITTWYVLLFNSDTTPSSATTYATPVFTESTDYDEANRVEYVADAAATKSITNSANKAVFTISGTTSIYGGALVGGGTSASTKGNTDGGGTMYCAAKFGAVKNVVDDDVLNIAITITGADT